MSPLARWCHRHRLVVVLAWVGLLTALGAAVGVVGSDFGNSPVAQNTDSARATALLREAASSEAGSCSSSTGIARTWRRGWASPTTWKT